MSIHIIAIALRIHPEVLWAGVMAIGLWLGVSVVVVVGFPRGSFFSGARVSGRGKGLPRRAIEAAVLVEESIFECDDRFW